MTTRSRLATLRAVLPPVLIASSGMLALGSCAETYRTVEKPQRSAASEIGKSRSPTTATARATAASAPAVLTFQEIAPEKAVALNAVVPVEPGPLVAAAPFRLSDGADPALRAAATDCLAAAIYYEAASESEAGQRAVAQVVLNRLRHPAYPKTVCAVVFQGSERDTGCQFTFTCDGSLRRAPVPTLWMRARLHAEQALTGRVEKAVGLATHYHTQWVVPYWRTDLAKAAVVGAHIFYRWQGGWGERHSFRARHAGSEALPEKLSASIPRFLLASASSAPLDAEVPAALQLASTASTAADPSDISGLAQQARRLAADDNRPTLLADQARGSLIAATPSAKRLP